MNNTACNSAASSKSDFNSLIVGQLVTTYEQYIYIYVPYSLL